MEKNEMREALADYAHEAWTGWMKYFFLKCEPHIPVTESGDGYWFHIKMPTALYERWKRQMSTEYQRLPESEKESYREQADKIMTIVAAHEEYKRSFNE